MNAIIEPDINVRVGQFVKLRDKIREIKERQKNELKPYNETLEQLSGIILGLLNKSGAESVRTDGGTAYKKLVKSATLADKSAFLDFVRNHDAWELLDYKANAPAVSEYIAEKVAAAEHDPSIIPAAPPGVNYSETWEVGINRPTTTKKDSKCLTKQQL